MKNLFKNTKVLITGAAGTIGKELIKQLLDFDIKEIKAIDNNEAALFFLNEEYRKEPRLNGFFCDIRDLDRLKYLCKDVDIILHTAAMKHVIISEISPLDAVKTNADGTSNVIQAALESDKVSRVIYTSSDKAVNPTNVMGTTKLLGERLMTSALNIKASKDIVFNSTRFGNVIGSKGSVCPIFYKQIQAGNKITITDERMTRFIMTIQEAARLVLEASLLAKGGEVFVTKMPVMRIMDLAKAMIEVVAPQFNRDPKDIEIEFIGSKPGEKLYEELMTDEETVRAYELDRMFMIKPSIPPIYETIDYEDYETLTNKEVNNAYVSSSEPYMSVEEIKAYIIDNKVIENLEL
ncbi:MAG: capsule biosynthesis protein CapD [endosymbiont of Escarpia spicata]|uniref:Capsule biosynthesis protein CapD n=1 Tax=endosymbiont of Escarpia spicata TaxID=2200908 RepID=A0A370DLU0_9GAMM|nr:MAG: capsule biosynthesis protein CapD [endosymbiont of Escarpia spicata]